EEGGWVPVSLLVTRVTPKTSTDWAMAPRAILPRALKKKPFQHPPTSAPTCPPKNWLRARMLSAVLKLGAWDSEGRGSAGVGGRPGGRNSRTLLARPRFSW